MTDVLSVTIINRLCHRPLCCGLDANGFLKDSMFLSKQLEIFLQNRFVLTTCNRFSVSKGGSQRSPKMTRGMVAVKNFHAMAWVSHLEDYVHGEFTRVSAAIG